jgi:uncharacterized lipoprotein YbaY/heat shock protein HslJ
MTSLAHSQAVRTILTLTLMISIAACRDPTSGTATEAASEPQATARITGTITYRERLALTDRAEVSVTLEDVSRRDVAAPVLARQQISAPDQVPIRFALHYSPVDIDERGSYAVRATIHDRGRLLFTTDTHVPVLTRGAGREAHLVLVAVPARTDLEPGGGTAVVGMELEGMFSYFADAARFQDCRTGRDFAVSMEGAYSELEHTYLNSGIKAGAQVLVQIRGRYLERPSMEGNRNEVKLIVDKLEGLSREDSCAPTEHAELRNTYWKLFELNSRRVVTPEGMQEAHLILAPDESRVRGNAGCNGFFGTFATTGDRLTFSDTGVTAMACPEGMDTEQAFLQALGETTRFAISGQILTLYADDRPLARLEAVFL